MKISKNHDAAAATTSSTTVPVDFASSFQIKL